MDKQSISLTALVLLKASHVPPNTYSPLQKLPDQDFHDTRTDAQAVFQRTPMPAISDNMQEASNISMTISTVEYRLLQPLGNRRRHALQLRGYSTATGVLFRGPTTENG